MMFITKLRGWDVRDTLLRKERHDPCGASDLWRAEDRETATIIGPAAAHLNLGATDEAHT
jgi:hypothetical protein